ncbi:hypothetical protein [Frigidibacter sp. ROC022]|uniref:hypothetical protein n=1 Tax=Frigidibacter sp. ROC022 TaxID=2971796 RepID=UPI00215AB1C1|nr:hypothetical protein [Frigidibacter sp. ROC022]MCR8725867.1 hypothetical protein [Frigidibacter sp. ROC022]
MDAAVHARCGRSVEWRRGGGVAFQRPGQGNIQVRIIALELVRTGVRDGHRRQLRVLGVGLVGLRKAIVGKPETSVFCAQLEQANEMGDCLGCAIKWNHQEVPSLVASMIFRAVR